MRRLSANNNMSRYGILITQVNSLIHLRIGFFVAVPREPIMSTADYVYGLK